MFNHLLFAILFSACLLMIYRATLSSDDWTLVSGVVEEKTIKEVGNYRSGTPKYGLVFTLARSGQKLGVFLGQDTTNLSERWSNEIAIQEDYTFYLDPSVFRDNGVNFGIVKITKANAIIYEKTKGNQLYFALPVTLLLLFFWMRYARKGGDS